MDPGSYGAQIASSYDQRFAHLEPGQQVIDRLVELAGDGPVLDVGAGTGRLALPLARRGVSVDALDISPEMLAVLERSSAGLPVRIVQADAAAELPDNSYRLILCAFNTFLMLGDTASQRGFLAAAADRLAEGGRLLLETFVPDLSRYNQFGDSIRVLDIAQDSVSIQFSKAFPDERRIAGQDLTISRAGIQLIPSEMHYHEPAELDRLAAAASLQLADRWSAMDGAAFTADSPMAVSLYRSIR